MLQNMLALAVENAAAYDDTIPFYSYHIHFDIHK